MGAGSSLEEASCDDVAAHIESFAPEGTRGRGGQFHSFATSVRECALDGASLALMQAELKSSELDSLLVELVATRSAIRVKLRAELKKHVTTSVVPSARA